MKLNKISKLIISLALPLLAGFIGSFSTMSSVEGWYTTIEKSSLTPPDFVFGPVWTVLYLMMGLAFYLVWTSKASKKELRFASLIFFLQLCLNSFWSIAFFGLESPLIALITIGSLGLLILVTMLLFCRISKWAGYLLLPYLLWVSFAAYLNYVIWLIN